QSRLNLAGPFRGVCGITDPQKVYLKAVLVVYVAMRRGDRHDAPHSADERFGIPVALADARRLIGDVSLLHCVEGKDSEPVNAGFPRMDVGERRILDVALDVAADVGQAGREHAVRIKPVTPEGIQIDICPAPDQAERGNHDDGPPSLPAKTSHRSLPVPRDLMFAMAASSTRCRVRGASFPRNSNH